MIKSLTEQRNATISPATRRILNQLRDCCLADWQWEDAHRTLKLRFSWICFLGGEGRDVLLYLHGVSRFAFECPEDKDLNEYFSIFDASLKCGFTEASDTVFYCLHLEGEVTLDATCQSYEIFEQVTFTEADIETMHVENDALQETGFVAPLAERD